MQVYCVVSGEGNVYGVCATLPLAQTLLLAAIETHTAYCGRVVWLDANLNGTGQANAWHGTVCSAKWERLATIEIQAKTVIG